MESPPTTPATSIVRAAVVAAAAAVAAVVAVISITHPISTSIIITTTGRIQPPIWLVRLLWAEHRRLPDPV